MGPKSGNVGPSFAGDITWERLILLSLTERVGSIVPLAMFTSHFHLLCSSTNGSSPDIEGKEIGMHPVSADLISGWKTRARSQNQIFCGFQKVNFWQKMGPTQGVRREIFSNTAGVLNWPSFSISIDFPTVYIDFLNILSKVGSREATSNNVIGNKSQDETIPPFS